MDKSLGTVKWFDNAKGYGFIVNAEGEDVFVHYRSIQGEGYKTLSEGQQVEYIQTKSEKGWQAAEVSKVEEDDGGM
jgi:CspA family cold shock protein